MFEIFPHKADVGIRGIGRTLDEAFCEAAKAMFSVMADLEQFKPIGEIRLKLSAETLDELFVSWLNELLSEASLAKSIFCDFDVKINKAKSGFELVGIARGEAIDKKKHKLKTEVKGATYSGLKVGKENNQFVAQCIVDV